MAEKYFFNVPVDYNASERLDSYICSNLISEKSTLTRSQIKAQVKSILVNGKEKKLSYKVNANDRIEIELESNIPSQFDPENIPLEILYKDENVCVINKEQGMVVHPACGNWNGTLVNALLFHWNRNSIQEKACENTNEVLANRRPGIVHRLDKETSGIIITAKNTESQEFLAGQFRKRKNIVKEYICICCGRPSKNSGVIKTQIIRDPRDRKKFKAVENTNEGKYSETVYKCISFYGNYTLMKVRLHTGRTHQIRVHMKYLNCPILGDSVYGFLDKAFPNASLMLHSRLLKINIPGKDEVQVFKTETPERFLKVEKRLKQMYKKEVPVEI